MCRSRGRDYRGVSLSLSGEDIVEKNYLPVIKTTIGSMLLRTEIV